MFVTRHIVMTHMLKALATTKRAPRVSFDRVRCPSPPMAMFQVWSFHLLVVSVLLHDLSLLGV